MELKELKYFVRIAELGSLSKASADLHVAQPTLSKYVASLEAEFGQGLLHRTGRGVALTDAGRELLRHAHVMLRAAADATAALTRASESPEGSVAVGFTRSLAGSLALPLFEEVQRRFQRLKLRIFDEMSGALADYMRLGQLNIAVLFDDRDLTGLRWRPLIEEKLFLAVKPGSIWATQASISLPELAQIPLVGTDRRHGTQSLVEQALGRHGLVPWILVEANSHEVARQLVMSGMACTVMSSNSVSNELARGEIQLIDIGGGALTRNAVACTMLSGHPDESTMLVYDLLVDLARQLACTRGWRGCRALADGDG